MKTQVIYSVVLLVVIFWSCTQVNEGVTSETLDIDLNIEENQIFQNTSNRLTLTIKNDQSLPVSFKKETVILEFTSYSGSIKQRVAVGSFLNSDDPGWGSGSAFILDSGEGIEMVLELSELLFGTEQILDLNLPANDYTINAFINANDSKTLNKLSANRSNYVDLLVNDIGNHMSYHE